MIEVLIAIVVVLTVAVAALSALLLRTSAKPNAELERVLRDEMRVGREEAATASRNLREEVTSNMKATGDSLVNTIEGFAAVQKTTLDGVLEQVRHLSVTTQESSESLQSKVESKLGEFRDTADSMKRAVDEKLTHNEEEFGKESKQLREEVSSALKVGSDSLIAAVGEIGKAQKTTLEGVVTQLNGLTESTRTEIGSFRTTVDTKLKEIQDSNASQLEEMRKTVDEKLQGTLEKRLAESFGVIAGHLKDVQTGLGEMKALATGVGDLKKVLTNVKARGTWAEAQLGAILEDMLSPEQYAKNVKTRDDAHCIVEYAVRFPGPDRSLEHPVWLPIDSKFPTECYTRLIEASQAGDADAVQSATSELARVARACAEDIREKYIAPPMTTDFAIMFLPTEGLYAEILRQPGLAYDIQQRCKVLLAGPITLAALLCSFREGFRTLAIEQRASEVWAVLGAVKTEFGKFADVLAKVRRHLDLATKSIDATDRRTRAMERRLRQVEQLPAETGTDALALPTSVEAPEDEAALLTEPDAELEEV